MKRRNIYLIILSLFIFVSCNNKVDVSINDILSEDITIFMQAPLLDSTRILIYDYGKLIEPNPSNILGEKTVSWYVVYKDSLQCRFKNYKNNWRNRYRCSLDIYKKNDTLFCNYVFKGKDKYNEGTLPFKPIDSMSN